MSDVTNTDGETKVLTLEERLEQAKAPVSEPSKAEDEMAAKLAKAGKKAEAEVAERRARVVKGSHLLAQITDLVTKSGLKTKENTGFLIVFGDESNGRKICIAKKGGRIDISGFEMQHPIVISISAEEAKEKHLGKVRGQIDFDKSDDEVLGAVSDVLGSLAEKVAKPEPEKKARAAKKDDEDPAPITEQQDEPRSDGEVNPENAESSSAE